MRELCGHLPAPFQLLYILHTPRGEGPPGRYQSPDLSQADLDGFFTRFGGLLAGDGRHDLCIRSAMSGDMLVWDRHNDVYVYRAPSVGGRLQELGFDEGRLDPIGPHQHHYRPEFNEDAHELLASWAWTRSELRPEDEQ